MIKRFKKNDIFRRVMNLKKRIKKKLGVTKEEAELLSIYLEELLRWNEKINLVGIKSPERIIDELLYDSILAEYYIPKNGLLLDIGSGAGIPAIPIKIVRDDIKVYLVEAKIKKAVFLRHIIRKLGLGSIEVINKRMEQIEDEIPESFDAVTIRGVNLQEGIELAIPYTRRIILFQGRDWRKKLSELGDLIKEAKIKTKPYTVYGKSRAIVIIDLPA